MKRFAILIESSDVKGQTFLNGAKLDVANLDRYLKSSLGGDWDSSEIAKLNKPSSKAVSNLLMLHKDDYCFVAFSGHGFVDIRSGATKVCLNDDEQSVDISVLKPKGAKGVLLVDACRGEEGDVVITMESRKSSIALSYLIDSVSGVMSSSNLWFRKLSLCPSGIVVMYSCSKGEGADEDPNVGGLFTTALMGVAKKWSNNAVRNQDWYSTKEAYDDVVKYLIAAALQQHPQYIPPDLAFPWAVRSCLGTSD